MGVKDGLGLGYSESCGGGGGTHRRSCWPGIGSRSAGLGGRQRRGSVPAAGGPVAQGGQRAHEPVPEPLACRLVPPSTLSRRSLPPSTCPCGQESQELQGTRELTENMTEQATFHTHVHTHAHTYRFVRQSQDMYHTPPHIYTHAGNTKTCIYTIPTPNTYTYKTTHEIQRYICR